MGPPKRSKEGISEAGVSSTGAARRGSRQERGQSGGKAGAKRGASCKKHPCCLPAPATGSSAPWEPSEPAAAAVAAAEAAVEGSRPPATEVSGQAGAPLSACRLGNTDTLSFVPAFQAGRPKTGREGCKVSSPRSLWPPSVKREAAQVHGRGRAPEGRSAGSGAGPSERSRWWPSSPALSSLRPRERQARPGAQELVPGISHPIDCSCKVFLAAVVAYIFTSALRRIYLVTTHLSGIACRAASASNYSNVCRHHHQQHRCCSCFHHGYS